MQKKYHAVVDAGSSGTRLFLYEVSAGSYPHVELIAEVENPIMPNGEREDGINNFINPSRPELADQVVALTVIPLLKKTTDVLAGLGAKPVGIVVDLFATAGMRYTEHMYGSDVVNDFYREIARGIELAGFQVGQVRTCDGEQEEGIWTWINLNDHERDIFRTENQPVG
ncbi:MAG: hypothetical protein ACR2IJ_06920, partial [Fluviibacter sp.]